MSLRGWKRWASLRFWQRLLLLAGLAALLATAEETLANARALATAGLTPVPVALPALSLSSDAPVVLEADGFKAERAINQVIDLTLEEPGVPLHTVKVTLAGEGAVNVAILLKDQASAYAFEQVYNVYCVAQDAELSVCYATAESAGIARAVCVR